MQGADFQYRKIVVEHDMKGGCVKCGIWRIIHNLQLNMLLKKLFKTFSAQPYQAVLKSAIQPRGKVLQGKFKSVNNWCNKLNAAIKYDRLHEGTKPFIVVPEVEVFRKYIRENPIAKMYLQGGLDQIPQYVHEYVTNEDGTITALPTREGVNYGISFQTLLDQFAQVTRTPPAFSDVDIIGVPFYALVIDLLNTDYGRTFFALTEVNCFLKPIYDKYGAMLDTPYSLKHMNDKPDGWLCEAALKRVKYEDFICNPKAPYYGFTSWHAWFTREIREEARPFNRTAENEILNNSEYYPNFGMPYIKAQWHDKFWLKDQRYSLAEVFGADSLPLAEQQYFKDHFEGGTVFQGFLDPWCYHHWRSPVSGVVEKSYKIGNSYYAGNPSLSSHLAESYIASLPLLTMTSVRQIYVIKADNPKIGRVCVIEIGMAEVSGIDQCIVEGQRIEKGARLGNFRFGGSSHAFVFDNKAQNLTFDKGIYERDDKGQPVKQLVRSVLATVE